MILSPNGYPKDNGATDWMDSARHAAMRYLFVAARNNIEDYCNNGILVRCPEGSWAETNPNNFSRDQLIPMVCVLSPKTCKEIFYAHAKRFFFCQNIERDVPGSVKKPWPHSYLDEDGNTVHKVFDYRDPLFLHDVALLIQRSKLYLLYWFIPVGYLSLLAALVINRFTKDAEQNQLICLAKAFGVLRLYRWLTPDYINRLGKYLCGWRDEPDLCLSICRGIYLA